MMNKKCADSSSGTLQRIVWQKLNNVLEELIAFIIRTKTYRLDDGGKKHI